MWWFCRLVVGMIQSDNGHLLNTTNLFPRSSPDTTTQCGDHKEMLVICNFGHTPTISQHKVGLPSFGRRRNIIREHWNIVFVHFCKCPRNVHFESAPEMNLAKKNGINSKDKLLKYKTGDNQIHSRRSCGFAFLLFGLLLLPQKLCRRYKQQSLTMSRTVRNDVPIYCGTKYVWRCFWTNLRNWFIAPWIRIWSAYGSSRSIWLISNGNRTMFTSSELFFTRKGLTKQT